MPRELTQEGTFLRYHKPLMGALAVTAALMLSACGGTATSNTPTNAPANSSTATADDTGSSLVGGDPGTWTPVTIGPDDNNSTIDLVPGQVALFEGLPGDGTVTVQTSDAAIAEALQPTDDNGVVTTAGVRAMAAGSATVVVQDSTGQAVIEVTINVTEGGDEAMVGGDPGTWAPIELTTDMNGKTIELVSGQAATWPNLPGDLTSYRVETTDDKVAMPMQPANVNGSATVPGVVGGAQGTATVTLVDGESNKVTEFTVSVSRGAE